MDPILDSLKNNYFSGQGDILLAKLNAAGVAGFFWLIGNSPKFEMSLNVERRKHKESRSGQRLVDKTQSTTKGGEVNITVEDIRKKNVALLLGGDVVEMAGGSYSGLNFDTCPAGAAVGSIFKTAKPNISAVVVKDSAGAGAELTLGTHYRILDAKHGLIEFLNLGAFQQPFRLQYAYATTTVVTAMTGNDDDEYALYFAGINTEGTPTDQKIGAEIYRIVFNPAQLLALINDEQGSFDIKGEILKHQDKSADANFGGFARLAYIDPNA